MEMPEDDRLYSLYPLSHSGAYKKGMSDKERRDMPLKYNSQILAEELEGYNLVASEITEDIFATVKAINASLYDEIYVQTRSEPHFPPEYYGSAENYLDLFVNTMDSFFGFYTIAEHFVKSNLVIDNFYGYSLNQTLLNMTFDELEQIEGLKLRYLQVDTKNKCVPIDWFIGYDTFASYVFINLIGYGPTSTGGYVKTVLRDPKDDGFEIDFAKDFTDVGTVGAGFFSHFYTKIKLIFVVLKDLTLIFCLVTALKK